MHGQDGQDGRRRRLRGLLAIGRGKLVLAAAFTAATLALTTAGVYAALSAQATGTSDVNTGELSLTVSALSPSAGFGQTLSDMAPGDTWNVLISITNGGTIASSGTLDLGASVAASNLLSTSSTEGLQVEIEQCSVAWTYSTGTNVAAPSCSGTTTTVLAQTPLSTVIADTSSSGSSTLALTVPSSFATPPSTLSNVLFSVALPSSDSETTLNGTLPTSTIQNLTADITWTFTEAQRAGQVTNS